MFYKEKIKELRERQGIAQKEMADIIGLSKSHYCDCENEAKIIPIKHLNTLCNYFNVSLDYIFCFSDIKNYNNSLKDIDRNSSGKRLKEFRKENKLTQERLASILNVGKTTITEYERGTNIIATPFLYTICKKYSISADYLLGKVDEPKYLK